MTMRQRAEQGAVINNTGGERSGAFLPGTIWITGLSASGKSTLGEWLKAALVKRGVHDVDLLDGEEVRQRVGRAYGFSTHERNQMSLKLAELAEGSVQQGRIVIVCAISHVREVRQRIRQRLGRFLEVYLQCPVEVCSQRDPKGHYAKAFAGHYENFIGVTEPYQVSEDPDVVLETGTQSVTDCAEVLLERTLAFLTGQGEPPP